MEMKDILKQHAEAIDVTLGGFGEKLSKSIDKMTAIDARLFDIEQKASRRGSMGGAEPSALTLGAKFASAEGLAGFAAERDRPGRFKVETKAILTSDPASAGASAPLPHLDAIVALPKRPLLVRNLLPVIPVSTGQVQYPKQTARTNNAAMVAETGQKPQSDLTLAMITLNIRKIAHFVKASDEILADAPQLRGLIDSELLYGLAVVEDTQLLMGDGTGVNLTGMMPNATAFALPSGMGTPANGSAYPQGSTYIDQLGFAILACALNNFSPDGIVVHPTDWWIIRLTKGTDGKYVLGDPQANVTPSLFGLPVIPTQAMPQGSFLVGEFAQAATLYDRLEATILASTEDGNNFTQNLVTVLAEERIGLAIKRAQALIKGTFKLF